MPWFQTIMFFLNIRFRSIQYINAWYVKVQIFTKFIIFRIEKNITKTQKAIFDKQNKKRYLDARRFFFKCFQRELQQEVNFVNAQIEVVLILE